MPDMTYRPLGSSGLMVSAVGLGCNAFGLRIDEARSREVVAAALETGVTLFDTADTYGDSEEILGRALGQNRDRVVLASKFGMPHHGRTGHDWGARSSRR